MPWVNYLHCILGGKQRATHTWSSVELLVGDGPVEHEVLPNLRLGPKLPQLFGRESVRDQAVVDDCEGLCGGVAGSASRLVGAAAWRKPAYMQENLYITWISHKIDLVAVSITSALQGLR